MTLARREGSASCIISVELSSQSTVVRKSTRHETREGQPPALARQGSGLMATGFRTWLNNIILYPHSRAVLTDTYQAIRIC